MKFSNLIFILYLSLLFAGCSSPSDEIIKSFKTVNDSLKKINSAFDHSYTWLYFSINASRKKDEALAAKADSIYYAVNDAISFLSHLKQVMLSEDNSGTNLTVAAKLMSSAHTADTLKVALLAVYRNAISYEVAPAKKQDLYNTLQAISDIQHDQQWTRKYFENTPTVAALTILSNFENNCKDAAVIVLEDIKKHLTN